MEETKKKGLNTSSNSYTIIYSVVIVVIVAFLLAFVSSTLKPQQDENVALDKKNRFSLLSTSATLTVPRQQNNIIR